MDRLPPEVLKFILENVTLYDDYVALNDLNNLRLSCKRLADFVAPWLFESFPVWLDVDSLHNLVLLSEDEVLCVTGLLDDHIGLR